MNLSIDWQWFIPDQIHVCLRSPKRLAWLHALLQPLKELHLTFLNYRTETLYKVAFNGQVINIMYVLNARFDPVQKGIYISDGNLLPKTYIYRKNESKTTMVLRRKSEGAAPVYIRRKVEYASDYEFVVNVPSNVIFDENELRAVVNYYKLADKRFIINIY